MFTRFRKRVSNFLTFFRKDPHKIGNVGDNSRFFANVWKKNPVLGGNVRKICKMCKIWEQSLNSGNFGKHPHVLRIRGKSPNFGNFRKQSPVCAGRGKIPEEWTGWGKSPNLVSFLTQNKIAGILKDISNSGEIYTEIIWEIFGESRHVFKFWGKSPRILHTFRKKSPTLASGGEYPQKIAHSLGKIFKILQFGGKSPDAGSLGKCPAKRPQNLARENPQNSSSVRKRVHISEIFGHFTNMLQNVGDSSEFSEFSEKAPMCGNVGKSPHAGICWKNFPDLAKTSEKNPVWD